MGVFVWVLLQGLLGLLWEMIKLQDKQREKKYSGWEAVYRKWTGWFISAPLRELEGTETLVRCSGKPWCGGNGLLTVGLNAEGPWRSHRGRDGSGAPVHNNDVHAGGPSAEKDPWRTPIRQTRHVCLSVDLPLLSLHLLSAVEERLGIVKCRGYFCQGPALSISWLSRRTEILHFPQPGPALNHLAILSRLWKAECI